MKMKHFAKSLVAAAVCVVGLTGCATLFKCDHQAVCFDSQPQGAEVYVNGARYGKTPLSLDFSNKKALTVTFKKAGFEDKTCIIDTKLAAGWVVLDVLGGFIPVLIDATTENWYTLESNKASAYLEPCAICETLPVEATVIRE